MSDLREDPRRRVRLTGSAPAARRVGQPNVLSDAAVPNMLSTPIVAPTRVQTATRPGSESWLSTGAAAPRARVRLPSFGTVIFLGFLAVTAFRLLGQFLGGLDTANPTPAIVAPGQAVVPGSIIFGTKSDGDCGVTGRQYEFAPATEVWWSATLSSEQAADAAVVVTVSRDGTRVSREDVPPDPSFGKWSVLCSGAPLDLAGPGTYRVEIRDVSEAVVHAVGEFRLVGS